MLNVTMNKQKNFFGLILSSFPTIHAGMLGKITPETVTQKNPNVHSQAFCVFFGPQWAAHMSL